MNPAPGPAGRGTPGPDDASRPGGPRPAAPPLIPRDEILARLDRTRRLAARDRLDGLLVIGRSFYDRPGDLAYLTNHFPPFPTTVFGTSQRGLGHGALVLPVDGDPVLVVDGRSVRRDMVPIEDVRADTDLARGVTAALHDRGLGGGGRPRRVGLVGTDVIPLALHTDIAMKNVGTQFPGADPLVRRQRLRKSAAEQALLRHAARVADAGLRAALALVRDGVTEAQVSAAGIAAAMEAGADFVRYLRVHSGPASALGSRWPQATSRVLRAGDLVAMDIIGAAGGYQFDVLRTTCVGAPDGEQRRVLDAVAVAASAAAAAAVSGKPCGDLVRLANGMLEEAGYGAHTRPFIGHGIGLETVEDPYLTPETDTLLEPGMALCIEPGVYIADWGGASIEHEVLVTEQGPEVITPTPDRVWA